MLIFYDMNFMLRGVIWIEFTTLNSVIRAKEAIDIKSNF